MATEIWVPILTTIIGSITTIFVIRYKHRLDLAKNDAKCPIDTCVKEDSIVISKLKETLEETSGDRLCIFSFHNGGYYYSGKSMQKMSMSYEELDNGISSTIMNKQNIPVSACISTLQPLMENGEFLCTDSKQMPEGLCKYHLIEDGVKSAYMWPLIDLNQKAIGILRLDYVKRKTKLPEDDEFRLKLLASQLPGYLQKKT